MESASERHGIKLYFLTKQKDHKSVSGDFNVSVVYDFFFEPFFSLEHSVFLFPVSGILFED